MISVENFYHVLYHNLLGPAGLDSCYYYPFGTTQQLIQNELRPWQPKHDHHVLFHFDQEPLWNSSLGLHYDTQPTFYSNKICKLLANSEHSAIKRMICQNRSMLDWYFFYHGFAARNWFQDARYLSYLYQPKKIFCSLNHIVNHKRSYRMALTARLIRECLLDQGDVSFHGSILDCEAETGSSHSELSVNDIKIIKQYICQDDQSMPRIVDHCTVDASFSARLGSREYQLWQNSFWHVVNETVFYDAKLHLTEKIFKPIVALRPFILVAAPNNLQYLRSYGFRTFDTWINEDYDQIHDNDLRLEAVTAEIKRLCSMSWRELNDMFAEMKDTLDFNKNHFFTTFGEIIVDELVDNFDTCIRVWNNGRVNPDRIIPRNYNIDDVKQVLKQ